MDVFSVTVLNKMTNKVIAIIIVSAFGVIAFCPSGDGLAASINLGPRVQGKTLGITPAHVLTASDEKTCKLHCLRRATLPCRSYVYIQTSQTCQIFDKDRHTHGSLLPASLDYIYSGLQTGCDVPDACPSGKMCVPKYSSIDYICQ